MKKIITVVLALIICSAGLAAAENFLPTNPDKYTKLPGFLGYKANEFIIVLKSDFAVDHARDMAGDVALNNIGEFNSLARRFNVTRLRPEFVGSDRGPRAATPEGRVLAHYYKVRISSGTLDEAVAAYAKLPYVEKVEKIGIHTLYATPNDTYYDNPPPEYPHDQWHYWDTYGINANTAWDQEAGNQSVIVGDLDIGTKYDHGDLGGSNPPGPNDVSTNGNIWVNTNEIPGNGIDDDGNGYIDDIIGWDFVDRTDWYSYPCIDNDCGGADNDPMDGDGHGTHTAGTIAAITNNGYAVAGVAGGFGDGTFAGGGNGVKVVPCRIGYVLDYWIYGATGVVIMDYVAEAMYYMAELKIDGWNVAAVNCSFGSSNSGGLGAAADYLIAQDVMIVVAAGNSNSSTPDYLGSRNDCLDVGATDQNGNPASFSNYGSWVDIAAPGVGVLSTITDPTNPSVDYVAYMDGTSMACPHVVGVAALLEAYNPALSAADKMAIITDPANTKSYNMTKNVGVGIVDAYKCLLAAGGGCNLAADFSGTPTSGCVPLTANFTDISTGSGIDGWSWTFGDGGSSISQNPSHTYNSPGTYSVTLTISSTSQGCNDAQTKTGYITVNPAPTAEFSGSPTSGIEPLTVNFTDLSADATGWLWDFGDGIGTSTQRNPIYTYATAGSYTVTLTASNACGSDQAVKPAYITVSPCVAPVADFSGTPTSGMASLTVDFTDLSSNATGWLWDFGDGVGASTQQNPSYIYNSEGIYTVTLTASNACGSDVAVKTDYITVTVPTVTRAYAQAESTTLGVVTGSYLDTYVSDNVYESIVEVLSTNHPRKVTSNAEHQWTFDLGGGGNGMTFYVEAYRPNNGDGDDFIFEYSTDGTVYSSLVTVASAVEQVYSVSMPSGLTGTVYVRVRDSNRSWGLTSLDAVYIDEMYFLFQSGPTPPTAEFAGSPTTGQPPLTVNFTDLSSGNPTSWNWDFGDGAGTSSVQNPTYVYNSLGTYTVSLTVTNTYGSDNMTKIGYIAVTEAGNIMFVYDMAVTRIKVGAYYYGACTVYIRDNKNQPVPGATVYVTATGPTGGSYNGLTGADGSVAFQTADGFKKPSGEWCFEVTDVTHATLTYDPASNNVTGACESGPVLKNVRGDMAAVPDDFSLSNHPNPFNPSTVIAFDLPQDSYVRIDIYNIIGQKVESLVDGHLSAGRYSYEWDGSHAASGIYLYRLTTDKFSATKKMVLMK